MKSHYRPQLRLTAPQKRVLLQLRIHGAMPRIHLGRTLGINGATVTRLIQQLLALEVVEEMEAEGPAERGRPMIPLRVSGHGGWTVGATVHPGWLELALVDFRGIPLVQDSIAFDSPDPVVFARTLAGRLRVLAAEHGFMRGKFLGAGIAVPGYALHADRTRRAVVDWLSGWADIPLAQVLGDALGMPVWIENDATAAALAEFYQPDVIGHYRSALVLFLGHGIGGGLIAERDLLLGEHGNAGEIGRLFPGGLPRPSGVDLIRTLQEAGVAIDSLSDLVGACDCSWCCVAGSRHRHRIGGAAPASSPQSDGSFDPSRMRTDRWVSCRNTPYPALLYRQRRGRDRRGDGADPCRRRIR